MQRLKATLERAGLEVETVHWTESKGKGLDGYLLGRLGKNFSKLAEPAGRERGMNLLFQAVRQKKTKRIYFSKMVVVCRNPQKLK